MEQRPNKQEIIFLNHSYNFFLDIYDEIKNESFWKKDSYYRFNRIRDGMLVYSEILEYEPVSWFLESLKKLRPNMEAELSKEYILFIRNLLIHFPFFKSWDEVVISKALINWSQPGKSIDRFLKSYAGHEPVKYRMWNAKDKKMTYITISFPNVYTDSTAIKLKEFMPEKEGIIFAISLMYQVLMSQVENLKN